MLFFIGASFAFFGIIDEEELANGQAAVGSHGGHVESHRSSAEKENEADPLALWLI